MSWATDIVAVLEQDGVGTYGVDIFIGGSKVLPKAEDHPGPLLSIVQSPGLGQDRTQNAVIVPAYQRPEASIVARAVDYADAEEMAWKAYYSLGKVHNQYIGSGQSFVGSGDAFVGDNGTWYREIRPRQEPFELGLDDDKRMRIAFNVLGDKRPSWRP